MEEKMQTLLNQIKIKEEYQTYFKDSCLNKIIGNNSKTKYRFYITLKTNLPLEVYLDFEDKIKEFYQDFQIEVIYEIKQENKNYIEEYYKYFLDKYSKNSPLLELFKEREISYNNQILTLELENKAEEIKLNGTKRNLEEDLKKVGYNLSIQIEINSKESEEIRLEIKKELETSLPKLKKEPIKNDNKTPKYKQAPLIIDPNDEIVVVGRKIEDKITRLDTVISPGDNITIEGKIFGKTTRTTKNGLHIFSLKITDETDSIYGTLFVRDNEEFDIIDQKLKEGSWYKIRAVIKDKDKYNQDISLLIRDINNIKREENKIIDDAEVKRVELHAHTKMSQMDGVVDTKVLLKQALNWGHKAIAITDHNGVQGFVEAFRFVSSYNKNLKDDEEKFKVLYGTELTMIDDSVKIVIRPNDSNLIDNTYVVFDLETTGFNAGGEDSIIEIGAVKILNGEIIDRYDQLVDPKREISQRITDVTSITNDMLVGKPTEEEAIKEFKEWIGNLPMVAHNAKFDVSFVEMAYKKYNLGSFENTVIDTLELSRTMDNNYARHSLSAIVKRYNVDFDEEHHHRADYDAEGTALVYHKMMNKLISRNIEKISQLDTLVSKDEIHKYGQSSHINIIAKNKIGLKNLFKIISLASTTYLYKTPRILRSEIEKHRDGLLIGSGCYQSEVFIQARSKSDEELTNIINFYDYVEVQPLDVYEHLVDNGDFGSLDELKNHIKKIVRVTKECGKMIVATGDVHHLKKEDKIYREIIANQKVPGGGRHPLSRYNKIPSQHFRTTREMLENFEFLGKDLAYEIVIENTNKIADQVDIIEVIIQTGGVPFSPKMDRSVETVTELVYDKAKEWYGSPLPFNIEERIAKELYGDGIFNAIKNKLKEEKLSEEELEIKSYQKLHDALLLGFDHVKKIIGENIIQNQDTNITDEELEKLVKKELGGIIGGGFDVIYLIAQKLVKHSNDDGYLVGSRGSVGSSFVATMMGITEVNPLPAHYRCPKCKKSIFEIDGKSLGSNYSSGFDLPDKKCPECQSLMIKDGQDMPFATFLGFNADKVPDIDLNFSNLNQADAHEYTKVLFGVDNVYRAGTIGTVADKTAFGFVKGYLEDNNIVMRTAEIERLALGCTGVKRTTGQHPGGIVVIPGYMDVFDFTPFQYPADDPTQAWRTTHFDYHAIEEDVLKLDILGHSDPTQLRMIQDLTGMDVTTVPLDDKETMSIFLSPEVLGVTKEQIMCNTGTLGIPEFGTKFTIQMVEDTKPTTFAELVKISGLSHGTDVWLGNAQELIKNKIVPFSEVIGCRDDIMVYLMYHNVEPIKAFKIMEFVRKGKASRDKETWSEYVEIMKEANIPEWFIDSCYKIKYMFPKAHAAAYVISAFRIAWYKVHMPVYYYASWLSTKATDVDITAMIKGYESIKNAIIEINNKENDATNKDAGVSESLFVSLEAAARGIKFENIDLYKSEATTFGVKDEKTIYPPFNSIEGLGDTVAKNIVSEREKREFISIEDLQKRCKISTTLIEKMRMMGILDGMDESSQLSLF